MDNGQLIIDNGQLIIDNGQLIIDNGQLIIDNYVSKLSISKALLISSLIIIPSPVLAIEESSHLNPQDVPVVYQQTREIYEDINEGDFVSAIRGILGLLGLLNPATEAASVGTIGEDEPYENPNTPEKVYETQRYRDNVRAVEPQKISQGVFGPGQVLRTFQATQLDKAQEAAATGYQGTFDAYRTSETKAFNSSVSASNVETLSNKAQDATASQDVLKAIAAQNKDLSDIGANRSDQLSQLTKANYFQASQLLSANNQLSALNDKTQSMEVLSASQNYLSAQIKSSVNQGNYYEHRKDAAGQNAARQASTVVFIPGLNF